VTQYNPETNDRGLFVDYINTFLKLKAEASGYPSWAQTHDNEDQLIQQFFESEGIRLERVYKSYRFETWSAKTLAQLNVGKIDRAN
jgi:hypothetical protein